MTLERRSAFRSGTIGMKLDDSADLLPCAVHEQAGSNCCFFNRGVFPSKYEKALESGPYLTVSSIHKDDEDLQGGL